MFKELLVVSLLLLFVSCVSCTEVLKLNGPRDCPTHHVTIYTHKKAEVSRQVTFNAKEPGELAVVIEGLSNAIDQNSIRVGFGVGDATLLEVGYTTTIPPSDDRNKTRLAAEFEEIKASLELLDPDIDRIEKEMKLLETWATKQANKEQTQIELENDKGFLEIYDIKSTELMAKHIKVAAEIKKLEKRKKEIETLMAIVPVSAIPSVRILLQVNNPGEINLLLSYVVTQTFWKPTYDIRVTSDTSSTQLTYYGTIVNLSGENWTDVSLALSTAAIASGNPPTLSTLKLFVEIPQNTKTMYASYAGSSSSNVLRDQAPSFAKRAADIPEMEVMTSFVVNGMSASHFRIPRKADIPTDGMPHKVIIASLDLPCNLLYEIMPKLTSHAYLKANVTNNSDCPLLAGSANVFLDNSFVNQITLKYIPGYEKFEVFLGIDNGITVERKADKVHTETSGYLVSTTTKSYRHESITKNTKKVKVPLVLYEQVPLSSDQQIKVNLKQPVIEGENKQPTVELNSDNILVWNVTLSPGEQKSFVVEYQIEYPSSLKVNMA